MEYHQSFWFDISRSRDFSLPRLQQAMGEKSETVLEFSRLANIAVIHISIGGQ